MGSLYIKGVQCTYARFKNDEDWRQFDKQAKDLNQLAAQCGVAIERKSVNDGDTAFVVMNKSTRSQCFYEGECFEYDMSIAVSEDFDARAHAFIKALDADARFTLFHSMEWVETQPRYFVSS